MIKFLSFYNFKCFLEASLQLNQLTILAGANGNGKSTAMQAILLLRNTIERNLKMFDGYYISEKNIVELNVSLNDGYMLSLGNSASVINRESNDTNISLSIYDEVKEFVVNYTANDIDPELSIKANLMSESADTSPILKRQFYYLNAERVGPRVSQQIAFYDYPNAGCQGEYVAQLISEKSGYLSIDIKRSFSQSSNLGIEFQVNEWLNYIMPGVRVSAKSNNDNLTAQIRVENIYTKGDPILATNIGFGISYVLPIIANGLVAEEGSYFLVENPEAHLHPSAQTRIGIFLAMVANAGVNVVIETHSDHVINGIQIAVLKDFVKHDQVSINFFKQDSNSVQPLIIPISINKNAELSDWPVGFFDQTQRNYSDIFNLRGYHSEERQHE